MIALRQAGLRVREEVPIRVAFRGMDVGTFYADIVVEGVVILELKVAEELTKIFESQLLHYLRSSTMEVGCCLGLDSGRSSDGSL
jgi:GxxExxY protein